MKTGNNGEANPYQNPETKHFLKGNPGRPVGSKSKPVIGVEACKRILTKAGPELLQKAVNIALDDKHKEQARTLNTLINKLVPDLSKKLEETTLKIDLGEALREAIERRSKEVLPSRETVDITPKPD